MKKSYYKEIYNIKIASIDKYDDGEVQTGTVLRRKKSVDVIALRILKQGELVYWLDMTISEALSISANLADAVNTYLQETGKYIPNQKSNS